MGTERDSVVDKTKVGVKTLFLCLNFSIFWQGNRRASVDAKTEEGTGGVVRESLRRASQGTLLRGDARVKPIQEEDN